MIAEFLDDPFGISSSFSAMTLPSEAARNRYVSKIADSRKRYRFVSPSVIEYKSVIVPSASRQSLDESVPDVDVPSECVVRTAQPVAADDVAVNVTAAMPVADAVRVLAPAADPSIQLPTVATPWPFDVALPPVTDPPPLATANVTTTPDFGFPFASFTVTAGAIATAAPGDPV